jgi:ABC-2 type transport system permease protein
VTTAAAVGGTRRSMRRELRLLARQAYYEQLSFWRNPLSAIFTVGFSVIFLILLAAAAGNSRSSVLHGIRQIQYYVPGFIAYGVMAVCFTTLSSSLVVRRETGLLKRLRLSPLPTWMMLGGVFGSALVVCAVQVGLLLVVGTLAYHVALPANPGALILALVVGALSFTALGIAVSTLVPNEDAAGPLISVVFFVLLFLSGLWYPLKPSSGLARFSSYFPIRHMITAVFAPFYNRPGVSGWAWHDLLVMGIWGVAGVLVAVRFWRWSPRRG